MNLNPFRRKAKDEEQVIAKSVTPLDVWKSPVDFNRATRRWAGMTRGVWRWNPQPSILPRYVRRHAVGDWANPTTRRQRRHRARILRAMVGQPTR